MDALCEFINMMIPALCDDMNDVELGLNFYKSNYDKPNNKIIEDNMMMGEQFSVNKFYEFALDKSKRNDLKQALDVLENEGLQLKYCWDKTVIKNIDLSLKNEIVSLLISTQDIKTFDDLFNVFDILLHNPRMFVV
jgi:hypothetical protein